ncbi:hypothetical protein QAD02_016221 [Eretmocerus hayati]|uniref:Uncharacterized protein n=1 Tax=Eretmocerus hayati TaxID=131215 RepID=A0ACC2PCX2_9HYME|nr:hypothetical protein QAD02_016221 [Eretmocerus hayati]
MSGKILKESFEVENRLEAFYTGGNIQWSEDGQHLFCQNSDYISVVSVAKGAVKLKLGQANENEAEDTINSFVASSDGKFLVTHHKSSLFKLWDTLEAKPIKLWKSIHNGPVSAIALTKNASKMGSGGIDGSVRLWDLQHRACTHNLKGAQGVVGIICYHPDKDKNLIFASADDYVIHGWNIESGKKEFSLEGHFSKVTSLSFHEDGVHALSSGRDKVLILWDLVKKNSLHILPVYESIEGAFILPTNATLPAFKTKSKSPIYAASAGEKGVVKIWEMKSRRLVYEQTNSIIPAAKEEDGLAVKHFLFNANSNSFALISTSHNILIYTLAEFECTKQLIGYIDEILDLVYIGKNDSHLAVATNTSDIKVYELSSMNCQILGGHTNIVLSLGSTPANHNLLLSSDKDSHVRLWLMDEETKSIVCIGIGTRHTAAVGSLALSQSEAKFFVSVSQDSCLKLWELPDELCNTGVQTPLNAVHTVAAHQKDINCVTVSPNDKLIATGSQDKTAKLWSAENLKQLGVFSGHRRGVWCVRFSPIDQVLATSSADCTIRLWSLTELNCLKTFQSHEAAVLRIEFLSRGTQLVSSAADGLIKLWEVKTSECQLTLDQHESRVWVVAVNSSETQMISGGTDSRLIIWRDTTQEKKEKALAEKDQEILDEQKLANYLQTKKLNKALRLSLKLNKPKHALRIVGDIVKDGDEELKAAISDLKPTLQETLLNFAVTWNTNARNCELAQLVIHAFLYDIGFENLQHINWRSKLESLLPYTERHFQRITRLYQDLHFLNYTVRRMKAHAETELTEPDDM